MKTYLFTWNPIMWPWEDLSQAVAEVNVNRSYVDTWNCRSSNQIARGDRAFLMRLGKEPKGIIGSGVVVSDRPKEAPHWRSDLEVEGKNAFYVKISFEILSTIPILGMEDLSSHPLSGQSWTPQASGISIDPDVAKALEAKWAKVTESPPFTPPSEEELARGYLEGTRRTRLVTSYERNSEAREKCIRRYGAQCTVCGFSFSEHYGKIGKGFIHVHHIKPLSETGGKYEVNPTDDLRPVCPNCHSMLHQKTPPYTPTELKEMMKAPDKGKRVF